MDFVDIICDSTRANSLLGLDKCNDEEEIDFEDDNTLFTEGDTETHTFTYTNDGSHTTGTSLYTHSLAGGTHTGPLMSLSTPLFQKTTPLFDAIEKRYWTTVMKFLTTGQWDSNGRSRLPVVPLKEEARQWSVTLDKSGKVTSRQLPIHAALLNQAPLDVVDILVKLYPNGASCADSQGNLPLHLAFQHNAGPEIISFLLESYPEAVLVKNTRRGKSCKGVLPMECVNSQNKHTKAMVKLCQEKARELSRQGISNSFETASDKIIRKLSSKSIPDKPKQENDNQEQNDLMEIRKELDDLRRGASTTSAAPADQAAEEPLDGWMRSISNFQDSFLNMGSTSNTQVNVNNRDEEDDIHLPAIEEQSSSRSESSNTHHDVKSTMETPSPLGRWKRSFNKMAFAARNDAHDDVDNHTMESFEVNLTSRSVTTSQTSASNKSKKRFPFTNPFRKSHNKGSPQQHQHKQHIDTVTVHSSSSKANLSVSRFSLSAIKEGGDASSRGGPRSKSSRSVRSMSSGKLFSGLRASSKQHDSPVNDNSGHSHELVFAPANEKDDVEPEPNAFSSPWSIEKNSLALAMSKMMVASQSAEDNKAPSDHTAEAKLEKERTSSVNGDNKSQSSKKSLENSTFLKRNEHSFLENALLMSSKPSDGPKAENSGKRRFGRKGRNRNKATTTASESEISINDNVASCSTSSGNIDSSETTSSNDSVTSNEEESSTATSEATDLDVTSMIEPSAKSPKTIGQPQDRRSSVGSERGSSRPLRETRTGPEGNSSIGKTSKARHRLARRFSAGSLGKKKREKKKKKGLKDYTQRAGPPTSSSDDEKKKTKFGLFRRRKSGEKSNSSSDVAKARGVSQASKYNRKAAAVGAEESEVLIKQLQQKASEAQRDSSRISRTRERSLSLSKITGGSDLATHIRQRSGSSSSHQSRNSNTLVDGSAAKVVLPQKSDWRADYENYLSTTKAVTPTHKKAKSLSSLPPIGPARRPSRRQKLPQVSLDEHFSNKGPCAEDILQDLESISPYLLDSAAMPPLFNGNQGSNQYSWKSEQARKDSSLAVEKIGSSQSTGPVVSESTVETNDTTNVYLVRVQF